MNDERLRVKDPRKAMLLAAIPGLFGVIGLGHFYAGYPKRGTFLMLTNLFALFYAIGSFHYGYFTIGVIVSILVVALWCGQIKEARDKARDHNHFQEMERIWYGDLHGNKGAFSVGSVDCVMENPRNEADFRIVFKVCIFGIVFSVLLSFGYWSPLPFIGGIGVVTFIWVVQWYAAYYRHPRRIGFGEKGMELHMARNRIVKVPWMALAGTWLSPEPDQTVGQSSMVYFETRWHLLHFPLAMEMRRRYQEATGRELPLITMDEIRREKKAMREASIRLKEYLSRTV